MDLTVGILGGGQLGRMLVEASHRLNIKTIILDAPGSPAKQINALHAHIDGSFTDPVATEKLAKDCDIITVEIEHVNTKILEKLEGTPGLEIQPSWRTIRAIQDKYVQKSLLAAKGVATTKALLVSSNSRACLDQIGRDLGYPFMLKSRKGAYDGRGNFVIDGPDTVPDALQLLGGELYAENWASFTKELSVMVVRRKDGVCISYPAVETIHENNICKLVYAPARVSEGIREKAKSLAEMAVGCFWGAGVFGVEMFLLENGNYPSNGWWQKLTPKLGELLVNEIAPRPHNSGHYTIEACATSQYEAHLRAILGLPLPLHSTSLQTPSTCAIMLNLLGPSYLEVARKAMEVKGATVHLYGKKEAKVARKMGHVTIIAGSMAEAEYQAQPLIDAIDSAPSQPPKRLPASGPIISIIMGSDSDLPVMKAGAEILKKFGINFEVSIVSAHRTPDRMATFAKSARARGLKVIIAGAGGAAHLPGMVAAMVTIPVIGVPVKGSTLDGVDSLYSIAQMPRGVPVATVAINNSTNAALLALRIVSTEDSELGREIWRKLEKYAADMESEVMSKVKNLELGGWEAYVVKK